jgi:SagB-type dehydrogenase family enzyme
LSAALVLSWREGVTAAADAEGALVVQGPGGRVSLGRVAPMLRDALRRLDSPGEDEERLAELVRGVGNGFLAQWYYYLERLSRRGLLCHSAHVNGTRLATLVVVSSSFVARPAQVVPGRCYILSRFAYLRREGSEAVLESPLAHARVILNDCRTAALVGALVAPVTAEELAARVGEVPADAVLCVFTLLLRAGMLGEAGAGGTCAVDQDPALQTWAFHDLLFHARSRRGRFDAPYGATSRLAGRLAPPPALKPARPGATRELYRPDLARLEREDPPLAWVQERRCSVRDFDAERPITDQQLGEFLFRVARVKDYRQAEVATPYGPVCMDFASRPYPAGGGLYELELYAAVNLCANLEPGLYHHDASQHRLARLCGRTGEVGSLLRDAAESTTIPEANLQVLVILAARFPRVAWKYESIAYALTLKHVGVVFQTMYLAATAMGLGPCAVGGGDADLFARAAGTDYCAETSVGEFLLGSRRHGPIGPVRSICNVLAAGPSNDLPAVGGRAGPDGFQTMKEENDAHSQTVSGPRRPGLAGGGGRAGRPARPQ